jgi:hypothetical protein
MLPCTLQQRKQSRFMIFLTNFELFLGTTFLHFAMACHFSHLKPLSDEAKIELLV